jgi:hypothetical protein
LSTSTAELLSSSAFIALLHNGKLTGTAQVGAADVQVEVDTMEMEGSEYVDNPRISGWREFWMRFQWVDPYVASVMFFGYSFQCPYSPRTLWNVDGKFWFPRELGSMFERKTASYGHHFLIASKSHVDWAPQTPMLGTVYCCIVVEGALAGR